MWLSCLALLVIFQFSSCLSSPTNTENVDVNQGQQATIISDSPENCLFLTSETGKFTYKSNTNDGTVCGIYLMTDPENVVEITFTDFDVPCNSGGKIGNLVQYVDGWELNGEVFPSTAKASQKSAKETEFCSDNRPSKTLVSSQNGALILYRIPQTGKGFTVSIEHKVNPSPCNIIHTDESFFVLKNRGKQINCSIWTPSPAAIIFNSYSVGDPQSESSNEKCSSSDDRIEIGGSGGLDTNRIEILNSICNKLNSNGNKEEIVSCSTTTIKLVSDGSHENYLNISMRTLSLDEISIAKAKYQCSSSLE